MKNELGQALMIFLPLTLLLIYLLIDNVSRTRARRKLDIVIHVNGTRGKSDVVRMIDHIFRDAGYPTCSKITGTFPVFRTCVGEEIPIKRRRVCIGEQAKFLKRAGRSGAKVYVAECMALRRESQKNSEKILRADLLIITNVRTDHLEVMGDDLADIGKTLLGSAGRDTPVITGDEGFFSRFGGEFPGMVFIDPQSADPDGYTENREISLAAARFFGLDSRAAGKALETYGHDRGRYRVKEFGSHRLHWAFAANDLESTARLYRAYLKEGDNVIWFNDRRDRPVRSRMFLRFILEARPGFVILSGEKQRVMYPLPDMYILRV